MDDHAVAVAIGVASATAALVGLAVAWALRRERARSPDVDRLEALEEISDLLARGAQADARAKFADHAHEPGWSEAAAERGLEQALSGGDPELALSLVELALERAPDRLPMRLTHARTLVLAGRTREALEVAGQLLDADPRSVPARRVLASCAMQLGDPEEGARLLEECLAREPQNFEALYELAEARLAAGALEEAHALVLRGLERLRVSSHGGAYWATGPETGGALYEQFVELGEEIVAQREED